MSVSAHRIAAVTLLSSLITLPGVAFAEWISSARISDRSFADVVAFAPSTAAPSRFYGVTREGVMTPAVSDHTAGGVWISYMVDRRGSEIYELWLESGSWRNRSLDLRTNDDGLAIEGMRCPKHPFVVQSLNGSQVVFRVDPLDINSKAWRYIRQDPQPAADGMWPASLFWVEPLKTLFDGRAELGSYALKCVYDGRPTEASKIEFPGGRKIVLMAYADLRRDGKSRFYGFADGEILELEESSPTWKITNTLYRPSPVESMSHLVVGDGRGDGRKRLYAAHHRGLIEIEWDGTGFVRRTVHPPKKAGPFKGATSGLLIGKFRGDGRPRVYAANEHNLLEFTFSASEDRWIEAEHSLGLGRLGGLAAGDIEGRPNQLLALVDRGGLYALEWRTPPVIAVLPFYARGLDPSEGRTYADILRTKIVSRGNCRVVERERIESVIREQRIHSESLLDPKRAVTLGRMLKADVLVTGSLGKLFKEQLASLSVLSVNDGAVRSSDFAQWREDAYFDVRLSQIAEKACAR